MFFPFFLFNVSFFVSRWVGAIAGLAYIFILPCTTYMIALHDKNQLRWYHVAIHSTIILIGIANFVSQFFTE